MQPFALSNGQVLPAGVIIEAPNAPVCNDKEIYTNPEIFDPLRFYKIRQAKNTADSGSRKAEIVANNQLVSSGALSLSWGYGRHACPGRFFAANEIKMILSKVLMQYEIRLPNGVKERYPNIVFGELVRLILQGSPGETNIPADNARPRQVYYAKESLRILAWGKSVLIVPW